LLGDQGVAVFADVLHFAGELQEGEVFVLQPFPFAGDGLDVFWGMGADLVHVFSLKSFFPNRRQFPKGFGGEFPFQFFVC
jgi:hypothetical protein